MKTRDRVLGRSRPAFSVTRERNLLARRYNRKVNPHSRNTGRVGPFGESSVRYLIVFLAIAGIVVSSLALKVHFDDPGKEPCSINDKWDCGVVNHSPYAMIHGVPVAAVGIVGYLLIAILALAQRRGLLLISVLIGMGFALYLTNVEAHVLEVWCLYCVISQGIIAILTIFSLIWIAWSRRRMQMV
jgi:vitamin-K-epoxide reductase (warfarin-sensitive)